MRIAFVADPLESLDPSIDTTVGLMHAAQDRGLEVWATEVGRLEAVGGRARALARKVRLAPSRPAGGHQWSGPDQWFTTGERNHVWLDEMSAVFMRTEPPLDQAYTTATLILDLVDPARTALVNDPRGLRVCSEHLLPLHFSDLIPPRRHRRTEHDPVVPHPARSGRGQAGRRVLRPGRAAAGPPRPQPRLAHRDLHGRGYPRRGGTAVPARGVRREQASLRRRRRPGRRRYRYPAAGDFRIGNPAAEAPVTARDREICARLAPFLGGHGIHLAGLDVIGPYLIEVNVTSVGALRKADALLGWTRCADLLDSVLSAPDQRRSA